MAAGKLSSEGTKENPISLNDALPRCRVVSVTPTRKKGHVLAELSVESETTIQVVTDHAKIAVGTIVEVAMPGAILNGKLVRRQKIAGEWSEGVIVDVDFDSLANAQSNSIQEAQNEKDLVAESFNEDGPVKEKNCTTRCTSILVSHQECDPDDECICTGESDDESVSVIDQVLPRAEAAVDVVSSCQPSSGCLRHVSGDASKAQYGKGQKIIAHICNDQGRWGRGFVMAITDEWGKMPGKMYRKWHKAGATADFSLGRAQLVKLTDRLAVANIIGQNGIKTGSKGSPVRYEAIQQGLEAVCCHATKVGASVHMPRIGCGLAGGEWSKIEPIIQSTVDKYGIDVYVYEYG